MWFAGEMMIEEDKCEISVYGVDRTTYYVLNEQGTIQGSNTMNVEMLLNEIKSAAELSIHKKVVSIGIIQSGYNVGDVLSDFNNYLDIS